MGSTLVIIRHTFLRGHKYVSRIAPLIARPRVELHIKWALGIHKRGILVTKAGVASVVLSVNVILLDREKTRKTGFFICLWTGMK